MQTAPVRGLSEARPSVLLIDDEDHVREAVALVLERGGFAVTGCSDALEALERLRDGRLPDVILLDLMMPKMDGWEFRLQQRKHAQWAEIPVVAMSADHSAKAAAIDADGYLPKPVEHRQLIETVARLTRAVRRKREHLDDGERLRPLGKLASEVVRQAEAPVGVALGNLQLAQAKANELAARLRGPEAFSLVGVRQLLQRAQRAVERLEAVIQGTAAFAQLAGADLLRAAPRVLLVDSESAAAELLALGCDDDYELTSMGAAEALERVRTGEAFDVVLCEVSAAARGEQFYQRLLALSPQHAERVLFIVNGRGDERMRRFLAASCRPLLRRPFAPSELRDLIDAQLQQLN